jgi:hypothetical protein
MLYAIDVNGSSPAQLILVNYLPRILVRQPTPTSNSTSLEDQLCNTPTSIQQHLAIFEDHLTSGWKNQLLPNRLFHPSFTKLNNISRRKANKRKKEEGTEEVILYLAEIINIEYRMLILIISAKYMTSSVPTIFFFFSFIRFESRNIVYCKRLTRFNV